MLSSRSPQKKGDFYSLDCRDDSDVSSTFTLGLEVRADKVFYGCGIQSLFVSVFPSRNLEVRTTVVITCERPWQTSTTRVSDAIESTTMREHSKASYTSQTSMIQLLHLSSVRMLHPNAKRSQTTQRPDKSTTRNPSHPGEQVLRRICEQLLVRVEFFG